MSHYHRTWVRYPHDAAALMPKRAQVAQDLLDDLNAQKESAYIAWAYVKADARNGNPAAIALCNAHGVKF